MVKRSRNDIEEESNTRSNPTVNMMKFVACATLLVAAFLTVEASDKLTEREGYTHDMPERLGHFKAEPFIDLYKFYAAVFVLPNHPERAKDDKRNYMPSGDECMIFLRNFRINQYQLRDLEEMVVLDACLGFMYANDNQEADIESSQDVKDTLEQLKSDEELIKLFEGTRLNSLEQGAKECVANLLLTNIKAKHQFPNVVCNNHYLQMFLQFAECQKSPVGQITEEQRAEDTYLRILYDLIKTRVGICVEHEIGHIERAVRLAYQGQVSHRFKSLIASKFSRMAKQSVERMWPHQVTTLLAAVQNTTSEVNQREVHQLIRGVYTKDARLEKYFLEHMAQYADKQLKPASGSKSDNQDPTGYRRYNSLVDSLCSFFRSSDRESDYDFATPIIRLVELLAHEDLFGISQKDFVADFLVKAKETKPIYLSVQACNILAYTEGALAMPNANSKQHYRVVFKRDTKGMVQWPDAGYF